MNHNLHILQTYPFEKLTQLIAGISPPKDLTPIALSIGEPKHPTPQFIMDTLTTHIHELATYPTTLGSLKLRQTITEWLIRRFNLPATSIDPKTQVLPVNGTREALFSFAQAAINTSLDYDSPPLVIMPNPFYQIYEGAALLAGAKPRFLSCTKANHFVPNFDDIRPKEWKRCQLLYLCSPANPTGTVIEIPLLQKLIALADKYDFVIAADECYSEIYQDEANPPPGLLQAAAAMGNTDYRNCIVFHSLSKRSNCPGLRSGFVAGDAEILSRFLKYRTYHGCAMPLHVQAASQAAWSDETHVIENRILYRAKFAAVEKILQPVLPIDIPPASFYIWLHTPISDIEFARNLFAQEHVTVLPGSFLSRNMDGMNPGQNYVRIALTPSTDICIEAAQRIRRLIKSSYT
jgi:N-succinyldiaminopimelate aminotransferase